MWILIISLYAGMLARTDSVALSVVPGFKSEAACIKAGHQSQHFKTLLKDTKFICVKTE